MSDLTESLKDAANRASHECCPERKLVILRALDEIERLEGEVERYKEAMNPRRWTMEHHRAWSLHIPDTQKAFNELRKIAEQLQETPSE